MKDIVLLVLLHVSLCFSENKIRLPDEEPVIEERRNGRNLFDFIGLGNGVQLDPYQIKLQQLCVNGEFSECFKLQALNSLGDFFIQDQYTLTSNAKVVTVPESQLRSLANEPLEYVSETRESDDEWNQLLKFALRKAERFVKSTAFEIQIPDELGGDARYSPRFIDDIYEEIDVLEDKKAPLFNKHRLKKIFIPMLLILKLFKLKLLLFLPFVLGITGLKKVLGFVAFVLPGIIGYLKLCKPNFGFSGFSNNPVHQYTPQYNANGVGGIGSTLQNFLNGPPQPSGYQGTYYDSNHYRAFNNDQHNNGAIKFSDDSSVADLAYQGYSEYRNKNFNLTSEI